jgi:hypothetical protein
MLDADVSGAPVVDDNGHLVGILSESDVIWKVNLFRSMSYVPAPLVRDELTLRLMAIAACQACKHRSLMQSSRQLVCRHSLWQPSLYKQHL